MVGCSNYPEHQASYNTPAYSTTGSASDQVISSPSPSYSTSSTVTAPNTPSTTTYNAATDRALETTVRQALDNNPTVATVSRGLYITSQNGTVTLTGTVPSEQDRQFIDNTVRNIGGVYGVNDQLQVATQPTGAENTRIYTPATTTPVVSNPAAPGNIFNLHVQGLDEPDRTLAQRILQELRGDTILPSLLPMVNITVVNGRVTLEGNVQNEQQRRTIEAAVQRAAGVNNVSDQLQVR
jgi:osmotically-inducible protein OsmY